MRWVALAVLSMIPIVVNAQGKARDSSETLLRECNAAIRGMDGHRDVNFSDARICVAYIQGYRDAVVATSVTGNVICIPAEATAGQLARVVVAHLQGNPKDLHEDRVLGIHNALVSAYRCK